MTSRGGAIEPADLARLLDRTVVRAVIDQR
jgi:hypothetical protein